NMEQSFRWISPGSVIATLLWVAVVFGFQIYLSLADPGSAYGVFGGLIVLLFFLFVTGIVFLVGAEINAVLTRRYDPATVGEIVGGRTTGELPRDTWRRTAQLLPQRPEQREVEPRSEPGPVARAAALGAV